MFQGVSVRGNGVALRSFKFLCLVVVEVSMFFRCPLSVVPLRLRLYVIWVLRLYVGAFFRGEIPFAFWRLVRP